MSIVDGHFPNIHALAKSTQETSHRIRSRSLDFIHICVVG